MVIWISSNNRKLQGLWARRPFSCNIPSDTAAAQFSPVLQGVLDVLFGICNNLAFRLLVFGFSWFLKSNAHRLSIVHIYCKRRNMSVYSVHTIRYILSEASVSICKQKRNAKAFVWMRYQRTDWKLQHHGYCRDSAVYLQAGRLVFIQKLPFLGEGQILMRCTRTYDAWKFNPLLDSIVDITHDIKVRTGIGS